MPRIIGVEKSDQVTSGVFPSGVACGARAQVVVELMHHDGQW
jgi:hypothetical protein